MDFEHSPLATQYIARLSDFMEQHVYPVEHAYYDQVDKAENRWATVPLMEELKAKAKEAGLWNLFIPKDHGGVFTNLEYAPLAEIMGRVLWAPEIFNCNAPDTGNMEVLERVGTPAQKEMWLKPLLEGKIRSAFAMTEPGLPSSDAKNVSMRAVLEGDEWVINGEKFYISGAGDPRCKIMITMVKTRPDADPNKQQGQILVPLPHPGVTSVGPMHVFGDPDAPHGHMHLKFENVRVPKENMLLGEGRGFEISQLRLGPGRIHHCMRSIGSAEKALDLILERGMNREAFGKQIINLGKNMETVSRARIEIEAMRMIVLKAAKAMDVMGNKEARIWVAMAKAMVPEKCCQIIDQAIQIHGATGVSQWSPLSEMYMQQRTLRLADGPDEVHHNVVARNEVNRYNQTGA